MSYIASVSSFYSDACIIYATLSVSQFALSKNAPLSFQSELWKRIVFGLLAGLAVLYLNQDRLLLTGSIYYSFAIIPMILATFFGGGVSGFVCYLVTFIFTGGFTLDNLFIGSIIFSLLLSRAWRKRSHQVFYLTIAIIAVFRVAVVTSLIDIRQWWLDILLYQLASVLCLLICYHALSFKERHIYAYFSMRNKATTDSLTRINNRASVDHKLMYHYTQQKPCGLMLLDLDNFKQINDTYGHLAGDFLLERMGSILQDCVRSDDFVGRYGGEEFIVITANHEPEHIHAVAERIRSTIEAGSFKLDSGEEIHITVSIGASLYLPGMAVNQAIEMTDEALYTAKRSGKNRVVTSRLMGGHR